MASINISTPNIKVPPVHPAVNVVGGLGTIASAVGLWIASNGTGIETCVNALAPSSALIVTAIVGVFATIWPVKSTTPPAV